MTDLNALSKNQILDLFRTLNGGAIGFDHERKKKSECIDLLKLRYSIEAISGAARGMTPAEPAPAPAPAPARVTPAGNIGQQIGDLLANLATSALDETKVRAIVDEIIGQRVPRPIEIRRPDAPPVRIDERVNPAFDKVLKLIEGGGNVMIVGPAGCGKTHLAHQVARALGKTFGSISGSAGVSEAQLTGRLLPTGDGGKFEYTESPFIREYTRGGVFLFDEVDAFDPNCLLTINQATANGGFEVEARAAGGLDTYVKRHAGARLIASANTYGTGAGALYVGRSQLDAATLDRWYVVPMDYDREFESTLAPAHVCAFVWRLREKISEHRLRRIASTRAIQRAAIALGAGVAWEEVKSDLTSGWTPEELAKVA